MSDIALDPASGDIALEYGRAHLAVGSEAVAQSWASHLTMFLGEWFLDRDLGIDYQNEILIKNPRPAVLRSIFVAATRETPGISEIEELRFTLTAQRVLEVNARVVTGDGQALSLGVTEEVS